MVLRFHAPSEQTATRLKDRFAAAQAAVAAARDRAERAVARADALRTLMRARAEHRSVGDEHGRALWADAVNEVARAAGERDRAFAVLSHELRQAVGAALTALRVSSLVPEAETVERARGVLERQLLHLSRIVEDMIDYSRLSLHSAALRLERVPLDEVIAVAAEGVRDAAEGRGQQLSIEHAAEPVWLVADRTRLQQVFSNLLWNAVRYTPNDGAIRVALEAKEDRAVVTVSDNGRGIAADEVPIIFEPFVRGTAGEDGGLGVGLALVKQIVELHGGTIRAESAGSGLGSVFTVTLPRRAE